MTRRLDIAPRKKLRGRARYERAFRRDMARLAGMFPPRDCWSGNYYNWKLPVYEKVASVEHGRDAFRREVVASLLATAASVARNKPAGASHARVAAIVDWPHLFGSEICVFFDRDYERRFDPLQDPKHTRHEYDGGWVETRAPENDLFEVLGTPLPDGFSGRGIAFAEYDEENDQTYAYQHWVAMEGAVV